MQNDHEDYRIEVVSLRLALELTPYTITKPEQLLDKELGVAF